MPQQLDPARRPNKGMPPAPDGMQTNPETGAIEPNDKTKGKKPVQKVKVTFPNMAARHYARRPYFVHDWYRKAKQAVLFHAGKLDWDIPDQPMITAFFSQPIIAKRFITSIVKNHQVPFTEIQVYAIVADDKVAATPKKELGGLDLLHSSELKNFVEHWGLDETNIDFGANKITLSGSWPGVDFEQYANLAKHTPSFWVESGSQPEDYKSDAGLGMAFIQWHWDTSLKYIADAFGLRYNFRVDPDSYEIDFEPREGEPMQNEAAYTPNDIGYDPGDTQPSNEISFEGMQGADPKDVPTMDHLAERALQHWDDPNLQQWAQTEGLHEAGIEPRFWLDAAIDQSPKLKKSLSVAVHRAERDARAVQESKGSPGRLSGGGSLMFDPTKIVQPKPGKVSYYLAKSDLGKPIVGDSVLVHTAQGEFEGIVENVTDNSLDVAVIEDPMLSGVFPVRSARKIVTLRVPLERMPKHAIQKGALIKRGSHRLRVVRTEGYDGYTKCAVEGTNDSHWVPDSDLAIHVRVIAKEAAKDLQDQYDIGVEMEEILEALDDLDGSATWDQLKQGEFGDGQMPEDILHESLELLVQEGMITEKNRTFTMTSRGQKYIG